MDLLYGIGTMAGGLHHRSPPASGEGSQILVQEQLTLLGGEKPVRERLVALLSPWFTLREEVWIRHQSGNRIRIDFVGKPICESNGTDLIGFETKSELAVAENFAGFCGATAQAIDYTSGIIESNAQDDWVGHPLRFAFIFPCPYQIYEQDNHQHPASMGQRDWWAQGTLKLAAKFGVGAIGHVNRKGYGMMLGGHPAFWLSKGPTDLWNKHHKSSHLGAQR